MSFFLDGKHLQQLGPMQLLVSFCFYQCTTFFNRWFHSLILWSLSRLMSTTFEMTVFAICKIADLNELFSLQVLTPQPSTTEARSDKRVADAKLSLFWPPKRLDSPVLVRLSLPDCFRRSSVSFTIACVSFNKLTLKFQLSWLWSNVLSITKQRVKKNRIPSMSEPCSNFIDCFLIKQKT